MIRYVLVMIGLTVYPIFIFMGGVAHRTLGDFVMIVLILKLLFDTIVAFSKKKECEKDCNQMKDIEQRGVEDALTEDIEDQLHLLYVGYLKNLDSILYRYVTTEQNIDIIWGYVERDLKEERNILVSGANNILKNHNISESAREYIEIKMCQVIYRVNKLTEKKLSTWKGNSSAKDRINYIVSKTRSMVWVHEKVVCNEIRELVTPRRALKLKYATRGIGFEDLLDLRRINDRKYGNILALFTVVIIVVGSCNIVRFLI